MGGGIGIGSTCKPMAVSFQCMTKFTTNKKKKRKCEHNTGEQKRCTGHHLGESSCSICDASNIVRNFLRSFKRNLFLIRNDT